MRITYTSLDEKWFQYYMTHTLGSLQGLDLERALDDGRVSLLGVPSHLHERVGYKE